MGSATTAITAVFRGGPKDGCWMVLPDVPYEYFFAILPERFVCASAEPTEPLPVKQARYRLSMKAHVATYTFQGIE